MLMKTAVSTMTKEKYTVTGKAEKTEKVQYNFFDSGDIDATKNYVYQFTRAKGSTADQNRRLSESLTEEAREYGCGSFWSDAVLRFGALLWL